MTTIKKILENIFGISNKKRQALISLMQDEPEQYITHPQGDFYVEDGQCINCRAPEAEAPDLMSHITDTNYEHCYFKKQPETEGEIDRAIKAVVVSCISCIRYRGNDQNILAKLYEEGQKAQCDNLFEPNQ